MLEGMKAFVQALPLLLVAAVSTHAACSDDAATGDTSNPTVTVGEPVPEACNGGSPDGYCNALGGVPETCACFDCVETAFCTGACNDNGTCDAAEDCTCEDCYDPGCDGSPPDGDDTTGPTTGPTTSGGGMGGSPATTSGGGMGGAPGTTSAGGAPAAGGGGAGGV